MNNSHVFLLVASLVIAGCSASDSASTASTIEHNSGSATASLGHDTAIQLATGKSHTCALLQNQVQCWGDNQFGQLNAPSNLQNPRQISAINDQSCAVDDNGIHCWGTVGDAQQPPLQDVKQFSLGKIDSCAIDHDGLKCWGNDVYGQTSVPGDLMSPTAVAVGWHHICAINNNTVECWGDDSMGQLDVPNYRITHPTQIVAGDFFTCVLGDAKVTCWGYNASNQLMVPDLNHPTQMTASEDHTCAVDGGLVKCWGGGLGSNTGLMDDWSEVPSGLDGVSYLSTGPKHSCAINSSGVVCWGAKVSGLSGPLPGLHPQQIEGKINHTCALDKNSTITCWGYDYYYDANKDYFHQVASPSITGRPIEIAAGESSSCALTDDNKVQCWGDPGLSPPADLKHPTHVVIGTSGKGNDYACAVVDDGIKCWGNEYADPMYPLVSESGYRPTLTHIRMLATNANGYCAVADEGLYCWYGNEGDLINRFHNINQISAGSQFCALSDEGLNCWGIGDSGQINVPDDLGHVTQVSVGTAHTCVIADGKVRCWGGPGGVIDDNFGQTNVPPDLKNPTLVAASGWHTCAATDDGVVCWGDGNFGQTRVPQNLKP